jgi:hypothetical protein
MFTLISYTDMLPMVTFLSGAIPTLTFAGLCAYALYCVVTENQAAQKVAPAL